MITLIGTGHVFNLSQGILEILDEIQPDIIGVELDENRFKGLLLKKNDPEKFSQTQKNVPFLYKFLARFQDSMADEYGVIAGDEMLTAISFAQTHQLPFELLDMNAQRLFSSMLKKMSFREKFRLLFSAFGGLFVSKKRVEDELQKIQHNFDSYMDQIGKKFPTIKYMLIDKRNEYMAEKLIRLSESYEKIVACVGDGHIPGISKIFKDKEIMFKALRLEELRGKNTTQKDTDSGFFTTQYSGYNVF